VRVALVHDWLTGMRGGERCLERIAALFPDAEIHTLVHVPGATSPRIEALPIHASPLSGWPGIARHYRKALALMPWAIGRFDLDDYDFVLSTHHAFAKAVHTRPDQPHLCYCFTPMRYVWDQADAYLGRGPTRWLASPLVAALRHYDRSKAAPERVDRFVAISHAVAGRIARHYGREARVVFPPVEVGRFALRDAARSDEYVLVGAFVPYKREQLAIEAFRGTSRRLVVVGDGPSQRRLAAAAPPNVRFVGRVDDETLSALLGRARALIYPQEEDFGIVAVEAQACGTPVVAYRGGGALDTVVDAHDAKGTSAAAATGVFFDDATPASLRRALDRFESIEAGFDAVAIRRHAERFAPEHFETGLLEEITLLCKQSGREAPRAAAALR